MTRVRNWARNQDCSPSERHRPTTTDEVARLVAGAAERRRRVKVIGAGHSFTDAAMTDDVLISLERMAAVREVDTSTGVVRVQAGIELRELSERLAAVGLALTNLGDINVQSISGAISTATHGTGLEFGNLATTIVGLELVDGRGGVVRCDAATAPDVLHAARVGVGALGIVTEVSIRCVPAFNLHAHETIETFRSAVADVETLMAGTDHVEFYWFPGTDRVQVKRNMRTDRPARPPSRWSYLRDKYLFENLGFGAACRVGRRFPSLAPRIVSTIADLADERELTDRSDRVFASPRHVRFVEMEYGLPLAAVPDALGRIAELVRSLPHPVMFPIEVRCSAADDIPLSTGYGRTNGWIAVHQYRGMPYEEYFRGVETIVAEHGARPHWGKLHFQTADTLRERYPEWDAARSVRARLDPDGTFRNAYLDRVLGPVT